MDPKESKPTRQLRRTEDNRDTRELIHRMADDLSVIRQRMEGLVRLYSEGLERRKANVQKQTRLQRMLEKLMKRASDDLDGGEGWKDK